MPPPLYRFLESHIEKIAQEVSGLGDDGTNDSSIHVSSRDNNIAIYSRRDSIVLETSILYKCRKKAIRENAQQIDLNTATEDDQGIDRKGSRSNVWIQRDGYFQDIQKAENQARGYIQERGRNLS